MQISPNKVVSLTYTLTLDDGEIADQTTVETPFMFIHGIGQTLPSFDKNLEGLKAGDSFSFSLTAEDAYGNHEEERIVKLEKNIFSGPDVPADLLTLGNVVPMQDQHGNPMDGLILEINDNDVVLDFNHPLAGQALHFKGDIVNIREASAEELDHGHVHGEGGHHH